MPQVLFFHFAPLTDLTSSVNRNSSRTQIKNILQASEQGSQRTHISSSVKPSWSNNLKNAWKKHSDIFKEDNNLKICNKWNGTTAAVFRIKLTHLSKNDLSLCAGVDINYYIQTLGYGALENCTTHHTEPPQTSDSNSQSIIYLFHNKMFYWWAKLAQIASALTSP